MNKDKKKTIYLGNKILLRSGLTFGLGTEPEAEENATTAHGPRPTAHGPRPTLRDPVRLLAPPEQHSEEVITLEHLGCDPPRGLCP